MRIIRFSILFLVIGMSTIAHARWERIEDAAAIFDEVKSTVIVHKDFSVERTDEFTVTLQKQEGVKDFSMLELMYVPSHSQAKILSAQTASASGVQKLSLKDAQDRAVSIP